MGDGRNPPSASSLARLPRDELLRYAADLGLELDPDLPEGELLRLIRERQALLAEIPRDALLDIVIWARVPVRRSASKEALARAVAQVRPIRFEGLSDRGLRALARLRGLDAGDDVPRDEIEDKLRRREGLRARWERGRRKLIGALLSRWIEGSRPEGDSEFLPEEPRSPTLKESIEDRGVVEGIAHRIRGAADRYLEEKLNEIERRIDAKLDEIDRRLAEWRDREIRNRLKLIKITLVTAIIVAVISLGYDYLKVRARRRAAGIDTPVARRAVEHPPGPDPDPDGGNAGTRRDR